jgi:hypothetical protein
MKESKAFLPPFAAQPAEERNILCTQPPRMKNEIQSPKLPFGIFSVSLVVHAALLLMIGGIVISQSAVPKVPFVGDMIEASPVMEEILPEALEDPATALQSPSEPQGSSGPENGQAPEQAVASKMDTLIQAAAPSLSYSMPSFSGLGPGKLGAMGGKGNGGGLGKVSARIFGKQIESAKLGVVFDVSFSTHATVDEALQEIGKSFPDAVIVLAPGCGMAAEAKGEVVEGKRYMANLKNYQYAKPQYYMGAFLPKLLEANANFKRMWDQATQEERMYVLHLDYPGKDAKAMINGTQMAFEFLEERGVDTIWWMADFKDEISKGTVEPLARVLKQKGIKVIQHDFDRGTELSSPSMSLLSKETEGQIVVGKRSASP